MEEEEGALQEPRDFLGRILGLTITAASLVRSADEALVIFRVREVSMG